MSTDTDSSHVNSQLEHAWRTHAYLNDYIKVADAKAGVVMAISGALCVFLLQSQKFAGPASCWPLGFIAVILLALGFTAGFLVVSPVFFTRDTIGKPKKLFLQSMGFVKCPPSLIFWNAILAYKEFKDYLTALKSANIEVLLSEVTGHTFELSSILERKYRYLTRSIVALVLGVIFLALFFSLNAWDLTTRTQH